jgi:hypothetical protein
MQSHEPDDTNAPLDTVVGVKAIAAFCGLSVKATEKLLAVGRLPARRLGSRIISSRTALREALAVSREDTASRVTDLRRVARPGRRTLENYSG